MLFELWVYEGPIPPNASEIILSNHLKELFDYGKSNFDYVIIDFNSSSLNVRFEPWKNALYDGLMFI